MASLNLLWSFRRVLFLNNRALINASDFPFVLAEIDVLFVRLVWIWLNWLENGDEPDIEEKDEDPELLDFWLEFNFTEFRKTSFVLEKNDDDMGPTDRVNKPGRPSSYLQ